MKWKLIMQLSCIGIDFSIRITVRLMKIRLLWTFPVLVNYVKCKLCYSQLALYQSGKLIMDILPIPHISLKKLQIGKIMMSLRGN